ncbi:MAG: PAS domain S-box protein [Sphingobacteriaceae bacterium]|nr:MAG: PAS domain S-box protein [Sphingobacteriaceae bacterium]
MLFLGAVIFLLVFIIVFWITHRQYKSYALKAAQVEKWHNTLIENAGDAIIILTPDVKSIYASPSVKKVLGYTAEETLKLDLLAIVWPDDLPVIKQVMEQVLARPGVPLKVDAVRVLHKDGTWHWYESIVTNLLHDPDIQGIVDNFRDVTEQVEAKQKLISANRLYAFISQINQALVHANNEQDVFKEACRIAVESGKFKMAWIGLLDTDINSISLNESYGMPDDDKPMFVNIVYGDDWPIAHIVRTGNSFICNDAERDLKLPQWREYAAARGVQSFMMLPIKRAGKIIGALNLYAEQKHFFDRQEVHLLEEVAGDISFAMGVFEKEAMREAAESKMRHSQERLNEAQAVAHVGSWEVDFATGVALWSDEALRMYGLGPDENNQTIDSWLSFIHPDDKEYVMAGINKANETLSSLGLYHRIICKDGTIKYLYSKTEFDFKDGKPVGIHGVCHDITDIRISEQAREQADANLLLIIDLIPQSIFVRTLEGRYLFVNKTFAATYGLSPEELMARSDRGEIEIDELFLQHDREVITTGEAKTIPELKYVGLDGNTRVFFELKVPFTVPGKNETAVLGIVMDITEQRAITANLMQRNKDLEQFSYIISHNLRAPVANILGLSEVLKNTEVIADDERAILKKISFSVKRLDRVINDLNYILEFKNQDMQQKEWVNFAELVTHIQTSIYGDTNNADVQIITDFDDVAGMHAIKSYLYSIFYNLIANSIKFRKPDASPVITIQSSQADNKLTLQFADNGIGMDMQTSGKHLFGLYKRFHLDIEGKGMGLYMVKTQVEALHGKITANSELGKGTEFTIEFEI